MARTLQWAVEQERREQETAEHAVKAAGGRAAMRERMKGRCPGWDHPDERCPRQPHRCLCWAEQEASMPSDDTMWSLFRFWLFSKALGVTIWLVPEGDSKTALKRAIAGWVQENERQWYLRYPKHS